MNANTIVIWDPIPGASKYSICAQEFGVSSKTCMEVPAGENKVRFTVSFAGLNPGARYRFSARAFFPGMKLSAQVQCAAF